MSNEQEEANDRETNINLNEVKEEEIVSRAETDS